MGTPAAHHATTIVDATAVHSWYAEARPAPSARHLVERIWHGDPGWRRQMRVLPDGCLDIAWDGNEVTVAPATVEAIMIELDAGRHTSGIRLAPHAAIAVLGRPAPRLDRAVPLDRLWPADIVDRLSEHLSDVPNEAASLLVGAVTDRAVEHRPDPLVGEFVRRIRAAGATVEAVGRAIGVSGRELRRRVRNDTALSPKQLQEVLRFRRALDGMSTLSLARTAVAAGYYDQAHLARQVRKIAGSTPSQLARSLTGGLTRACGGP